MSLCIKDKCKRCDIGYLIKDYIKPLMQSMTVEIKEYNMRLIETKCLNTAVMFFVLFFGMKALKHTAYCDVHNVVERHKSNEDDNVKISSNMYNDILRKTSKRHVYYVMLTDGYFTKPDGSRVFFPGHVFVLEKVPWGDNMFFHIYQSYIQQYTFGEFVDKYKSIKLSEQKMRYYLSSIMNMVVNRVWNEAFIKFYKDMTKVDTSHMLNGIPDNAFYVCYRKVPHHHCVKNLNGFVKSVLKKIPDDFDNTIYGDISSFDQESNPLTNGELKKELSSLLKKLQNNMSSEVNYKQ